jgi:hypothetical protein
MTNATSLRIHYRYRVVAIAALFLCLQIGAIWHLAEYDEARHSHDGVSCVVGVAGECPVHTAIDVPSTIRWFGVAEALLFSRDLTFRKPTVTAHLNIRAPPFLFR